MYTSIIIILKGQFLILKPKRAIADYSSYLPELKGQNTVKWSLVLLIHVYILLLFITFITIYYLRLFIQQPWDVVRGYHFLVRSKT